MTDSPLTVPARDQVHAPCCRRANPGGLTNREYEVVALIARGLTNQEIADRLFVSINSVKTYIRAAYRKMEVDRRTQAVLWFISQR